MSVIPPGYEALVKNAVAHYWATLSAQANKQGGGTRRPHPDLPRQRVERAVQLNLNLTAKLPTHAYEYGNRTSGEVHGVVLTKPHIVELILDLAGYTVDRDLGAMSLLEPSCGHGAFLIPAVVRLLDSAKREGRSVASLEKSVLAVDIDAAHVEKTKQALVKVLLHHEISKPARERLVEAWVKEDDFLLTPLDRQFDVVVGNPPYIRIEQGGYPRWTPHAALTIAV